MKKINPLFMSGIMALCFSLSVAAQSSDKTLDQAESVKQFIGTWEAELGEDTITTIKWTPLNMNNGLDVIQEFKANGNVFATSKVIIGLSEDKEMLINAIILTDGTICIDYGKFVSKKKYIIERYMGNTIHAISHLEFEFLTPESFVLRGKWRGNGMTWPDNWLWENTFRKID